MKNDRQIFQKLIPYSIFGLVILLSSSIITNIYFYNRSQKRIFDCSLGEKIEIDYTEQGTTVVANIVYPSNIVSGTKYNQPVILKTGNLSQNYYVRAKAMYADYNIVNESINVEISPNSEWQIGYNNYYYLTTPIDAYREISFIDQLTLPQLDTEVRNNTIITIIFEFLSTEFDVETLWKTPPSIFS